MKSYITTLFFVCTLLFSSGITAEDLPSPDAAWREVFGSDEQFNIDWQPEGMRILVPHTRFTVADIPSASNGKALVVEAIRSAGARLIVPQKINWQKTPVLRWRWRLIRPVIVKKGKKEPDDQAGVLYIGDGTLSSIRCIAYRWEKFRPVGAWSRIRYAAGRVEAHVQCVANDSTPLNEWHIEEHDVVQDFIDTFGSPPKERFVLCIGANTQHSKSDSRLEIDFIEFVPRKGEKNE